VTTGSAARPLPHKRRACRHARMHRSTTLTCVTFIHSNQFLSDKPIPECMGLGFQGKPTHWLAFLQNSCTDSKHTHATQVACTHAQRHLCRTGYLTWWGLRQSSLWELCWVYISCSPWHGWFPPSASHSVSPYVSTYQYPAPPCDDDVVVSVGKPCKLAQWCHSPRTCSPRGL